MLEQTGIFLVLEGADGSGKGTQFNLLAERLKAVGYDVEIFDFPRYDEPSSHFAHTQPLFSSRWTAMRPPQKSKKP
jgi:thymidylate kinase